MDVVIVGAGVIGCAVARELAARGVACTIVDDRAPGGGSTQAAAGMLAPYVEAHHAGPLQDLGVRSLALYDDWIAALRRDTGIEIEYRRVGTLQVALDDARAAELRAMAAPGSASKAMYSDAAATTAAHPELGKVAGALFTPVHGYVATQQLTDTLVEGAERQGTTLHRGRAIAIEKAAARMSVRTTTGTLASDAVVVASGAWTTALEIAGASAPPLKPIRGQLVHLAWHGRRIGSITGGPLCYVVPRLDGTVLLGATGEDVGFDERTTAAGVHDLLDAFCELLPEGRDATFLGTRVGLRPATPDFLPVLGPDPRLPGIVYATGHFRNGVLLAPITAKLVADWVVDGRRDASFDALTVGRFFAHG